MARKRGCKNPTVWGNIASAVLVSNFLPSGCVSSWRNAFKCVSPRRFRMFSKFAPLKCVSPRRFDMFSRFAPSEMQSARPVRHIWLFQRTSAANTMPQKCNPCALCDTFGRCWKQFGIYGADCRNQKNGIPKRPICTSKKRRFLIRKC